MMVYIDNFEAKFGRMIMCHMMADSTEELIEMANKIGVATKWIQYPGTYKEHFDVCKSKASLAVSLGAKRIGVGELGKILEERRIARNEPI